MMVASLKAEFRKLYTVRSTYVIILFSMALAVLFAFYADGYRASASSLRDPGHLANEAVSAINAVGVLGALVGVLLFTHEYRYNTIMYTLTLSRSRTRTLFAKILVVSVFAALFAVLFAVLAPLLTLLGLQVHHLHMIHQQLDLASLAWRCIFAGWAYAMLALILASLIRSQVGAIAALFLLPGTVEALLTLALKGNGKYLPFTATSRVLVGGELTHGKAALVSLAYIVGGWIIAWYLFIKRDAN